jgi:hypothetical protein
MRRLVASSLLTFVAGCAGMTSSSQLGPGEGYEVVFSTVDPKLHIRAISIDSEVLCEPASEAQGRPECGETFTTRVAPGRHYLQIQVTKPGETGHDDAEQRIMFESAGRYACEISEKFVTTHKTAVDESGFPEPIVECRVLPVADVSAADEAAADAPDQDEGEGEDAVPAETDAAEEAALGSKGAEPGSTELADDAPSDDAPEH